MSLFQTLHTFKRYILVGGVNTLLCFSVMYVGACLGLGYLVYTAVGYLTTITLSFFMNLRFTFRVRDRTLYRLVGFMTVSLTNLAIVEFIEYTLIEYFHLYRQLAILCGMSWYVVCGFLLNNFVVYRHAAPPVSNNAIKIE